MIAPGHDRYHRAAHHKAAALLGEPGLHAAAGIESEGGAAGSAMASTRSSVLARSSSAPSRVPGAPPRTSIAVIAGGRR